MDADGNVILHRWQIDHLGNNNAHLHPDYYNQRNRRNGLSLSQDHHQNVPYARGDILEEVKCVVCFENISFMRICCSSVVCDDCMDKYVEYKVSEGALKLHCPCFDCNGFVEQDEVIFRLKGDLKHKYYRWLEESNSTPFKKLCPHCSTVTKIPETKISNKGLKIDCETCNFEWCFACQVPWHDGAKCSTFRRGYKQLNKWANQLNGSSRTAQRCPKCHVLIERLEGCNHVTCSRCDTEFCFDCRFTFQEGDDEDHDCGSERKETMILYDELNEDVLQDLFKDEL